MFRASGKTTAGRPFIVLGLTEENLVRMRADQPIHIHADDLGFPGEIIVVVGETEEAIAEMFSEAIGDKTTIIDEREKKERH